MVVTEAECRVCEKHRISRERLKIQTQKRELCRDKPAHSPIYQLCIFIVRHQMEFKAWRSVFLLPRLDVLCVFGTGAGFGRRSGLRLDSQNSSLWPGSADFYFWGFRTRHFKAAKQKVESKRAQSICAPAGFIGINSSLAAGWGLFIPRVSLGGKGTRGFPGSCRKKSEGNHREQRKTMGIK